MCGYNIAMTDEKDRQPPRPSLARALRKGFRAAYDNLGYVVFATFAVFLVTSAFCATGAALAREAQLGVGGIVLYLPAVCAAWISAAGVFYHVDKSVYHEYPSLVDTWTGIKTLAWPAAKLFVLDLAVTTLLLGDAVFFLTGRRNPAFAIFGVACGYAALVWMMTATYHLPLLVAQLRMESGPRPFVVVRKSCLLTLDNPGFTVGLFVVIIALAILCAVPAFIGAAVFYLGAAAFVLTHALRELFVKYGIVEEEPEVIEDDGWPRS